VACTNCAYKSINFERTLAHQTLPLATTNRLPINHIYCTRPTCLPAFLQDVRSDPTLPRTRDVRCPACAGNEAVFFTASTEEGMTLFFNCTTCGHRWRDYV